MAYVSRLPRGAYFDPPATDEHVGPGTYQSLNTYNFNASASPFNTSSPRQTLECFNKEAMKNPGPGAYARDIPFITENNGGKEFKSKVGRFDYNISANPGPGAYKTKGFTDKYKRSRSAPKRTQPYFTWTKVQMAPTIPAKSQSYGYEMTKSGELIMLKPKTKIYAGDTRDSVGPGQYNPDKPFTNRLGAKTKYKVDKTNRHDFTKDGKGNPGPGTYDGLTKMPFEKPVKQSPNFLSQVKKGLVFDNTDAVLTPGVGSYNLYKGIVPKTSKCGEFDTTAPRFDYKYNGAPGPGAYDPNVASFPPVRKLPKGAQEEDIPKIPFHSSTFRFDQGRDEEVPGAGSYPLPSFLDDLQKKKKSSMFNSKVGRFDYNINSTPGPGTYKAPESIHIKPYGQSSQFKSKSKKGEIFVGEKDNPPPGAYTTQLSWKTNQGDHLHKDKIPRFDWKTNGVPGPGTYDTGVISLHIEKPRNGEMLVRSKRFNNKIENIPGPGAYDAEYMYGNLNKPTFNITIAKETKNR